MSQFAAAFDAATAASQEAMLADVVTRLEEMENRSQSLQTQHNDLLEALVGSTESFYSSAGGALERLDETVGDGLKILARIVPTGTILYTLQTDRLALLQAGWLICDGGQAAKADFPELYDILGSKWGLAAQSSLFRLPAPRQLFVPTDELDALDLVNNREAAWIIRI